MKIWHVLLLALALAGGMTVTSGCSASRNGEMVRAEEPGEPAPIRPVRPLDEEKSWTDRAGEILVVLVGIGLAVGGVVAGLAVGGAL